MINKAFVTDLAERAIKTFLQAFLAVFTGTAIANGSDLKTLAISAASAGGAAVLSLVTSLVSSWKTGTASLSPTVAATAVEQPNTPTVVVPENDYTPEH